MLKTKALLQILSQDHQQAEFKNFDFIFAKKICDFRQKREKRPHQAGFSCAWAGLWSVVTLAYIRHFAKFLDFFDTQMLATLLCANSFSKLNPF